jgi:general secretion pathway protein E
LEGITQNKLAANASPAEEAKSTSWVISQEPDAIMISKIEDRRSATDLIKYAKGGKAVYVGMQAGSTFEALDAWRKLVGDDRLATDQLRLIIAGRVLRKLCNACKVGYAPDPGTLRKLNMNPDKVSTLFQARTQPLRDQKGNPIPCEFCNDLRFKGRTGVFETFLVDDEVREVIAAGGSANQLKAVFRKQRAKLLQEEALGLVEKGDTSVQEVLRVLKGGESPPPEPAGVPVTA